eukprot:GSA25T00021017001.1
MSRCNEKERCSSALFRVLLADNSGKLTTTSTTVKKTTFKPPYGTRLARDAA